MQQELQPEPKPEITEGTVQDLDSSSAALTLESLLKQTKVSAMPQPEILEHYSMAWQTNISRSAACDLAWPCHAYFQSVQ